jgi:hypothetical protein
LQICDGSAWNKVGSKGATYRWTVWSTHDQSAGWHADNRAELFGGKNPQSWGDGNAYAYQMSSDSDVLRTLFVRRGPPIGTLKNATVYANTWRNYSSTNSKHIGALFRIKNTTKNNVTWTPHWYKTSYSGWGERASIAVNGKNVWTGSNENSSVQSSHNISIPANRTSTVIFVTASSQPSGDSRACFMAFYNNSLVLPKGLEYVDDLDTKPNGWNN